MLQDRVTEHERNCPLHFKPKLYRRYVDDTFLLFSDPSHIPLFLNYLNSQHTNISFTYEKETNNSLNFLDVLVERKDNAFFTSVYRKPTFTGLGLRYDSFLPNSYKNNLIQCLIHRAYKISSTFNLFHLDVQKLRQFFSANFFFSRNILIMFSPLNYPFYLFLNYLFILFFLISATLVTIARKN